MTRSDEEAALDEALMEAIADSPFEQGMARAELRSAPAAELEEEVSAAIALLEVDGGSFEVVPGDDTFRVVEGRHHA